MRPRNALDPESSPLRLCGPLRLRVNHVARRRLHALREKPRASG